MKISFTTLGCPKWDLDEVVRNAKAMEYDGVDFRGLAGGLDVTLLPVFTTGLSATAATLRDAGLVVSGFSSSIVLCDAAKRKANLDEARRTLDAARGLGCKVVRVFGGGDVKAHARKTLADAGLACMEHILALDGAREVAWLFETHDNWVATHDMRMLLDRISDPAFGVLWDIAHSGRLAGESPESVVAAVGKRVGYTHIKDVVKEPGHPHADADGWRYVLPGEGQAPLEKAIRLLQGQGYDGWLVFEHEKRWIPSLPEPEVALPAFAAWARRFC